MTDTPTLKPAPGAGRTQSRSPFSRRRAPDGTPDLRTALHSAREQAREPAPGPESGLSAPRPNSRDAFFRRVLAAADLGAAAGGLAIASLVTAHAIEPAGLIEIGRAHV